MSIRREFLVIILGFYFLNSFAQSDYRAGYIIKNSRDTVYGLIDYRGDIRSSKVCLFKSNSDSEIIKYNPGEIFAFRFLDSKYYISKELPLNDVNTVCFAEFLINGIVNVYFIKDISGERFFIEDDKGLIKELRNDEIDVVKKDATYRKRNKKYIGILKVFFSDSKEIQERVEKIRFNREGLIDITKKYHQQVCKDYECLIYEKKPQIVRFKFAPVYSINYSDLNLDLILDNSSKSFETVNFKKNINNSFGIKSILWLPRINEKISIEYEIYFNQKSHFNSFSQSLSSITTYYYDIYMKTKSLGNTLLLKYTYPKGKIRPTITLGFDLQSIIESNIRSYTEKETNGIVYSFENVDIPIPKTIYGPTFGLGLDYCLKNRNIFIQLMYFNESGSFTNVGNNEAISENIRTKIKNFSLKFGITLN